MVHGKNRIPYWIDRRLTGLAGPDDDASISFGLPFELGDCSYGKSRSSRFLPTMAGGPKTDAESTSARDLPRKSAYSVKTAVQ